VAKGYTQTYGIDYFETFSPVAWMNSIRILFSIAVNLSWPLFQLDVKNVFFIWRSSGESLYGATLRLYCSGETKVCRHKKAIYGLKQSPRAWFEKFSLTISVIGFHQCHSDHSVFVQRIKSGIVVLNVYVDILLTGSDSAGLLETKQYLKCYFVTKDMRCPKYFLGINVAH